MPMPQGDTHNEASQQVEPRRSSADRTLSEEDRRWLASHVSGAAEKAFPTSERIGKTRQQDFYFRQLLEVLIENTLRSGAPMTGGTYAEIWEFTRTLIPKWRAQPAAVRGRSGYGRQSIKTLVHEWKAAFMQQSRAVTRAAGGLIEFFLESPGPESDDLVLRAQITDLSLPSGQPVDFREDELSSTTRLPSAREASSGSDEDEKLRLLREARKYVRRVEAEYLAKLSQGPIEFIEEEVNDLRRHRNNHRKIAAAVLGIITAGMIGYQILKIQKIEPVVEISPGKRGGLTNVVVDKSGRIALSSEGKRTSEWAHMIVDDAGNWMRVNRQLPGGAEIMLKTDELQFNFEIPKRWHENAEVVLEPEGSCTKLINPERGVLCVLLIDIRRCLPTATGETTTFVFNWGDDQRLKTAYDHQINAIKPRVVVKAFYGYKKDGVYDAVLVMSDNPENRTHKPVFNSGGSCMLPIARLSWKNGRMTGERLLSVPQWLQR